MPSLSSLRTPSLLLLAGLLGSQQTAPRVQSPFQILSIAPARHALAVQAGTSIRIEFTQPIDLATFPSSGFHVAGHWSGPCPGTTSTGAGGRILTFQPAHAFSPGETVEVALASSIRALDGTPLGRSFGWTFVVASGPGSWQFALQNTLFGGDRPYGAYGGDIDGDGDLDICTPNEDSTDVTVFLNGGGGNFGALSSYPVGHHCSPNEAADLDMDGKQDYVVCNVFDGNISCLRGNGDGTFQPQVQYSVGLEPRGIDSLDADGDGDLDLVVANRFTSDMSLLRNKGDGRFLPEIRFQGGVEQESGVAAADMNEDGFLDLVVIGYWSGDASILLGTGAGYFALCSIQQLGAEPWMVTVGDLDGDGHLDIGSALSGGTGLAGIARGDGTGHLYPPTTYATGGFPTSIDFADIDGDGDLDLATSAFTGMIFRLRQNNGDGVFGTGTDLPAILSGSCTVLHDIDGDGDIDVTAVDELDDRIYLFRQL